jgi:hypothetical protein
MSGKRKKALELFYKHNPAYAKKFRRFKKDYVRYDLDMKLFILMAINLYRKGRKK